jgi:hypothetical protein
MDAISRQGLRSRLNRLNRSSRVRQVGDAFLESGEVTDWKVILEMLASPTTLQYREMQAAIWIAVCGAKSGLNTREVAEALTGILHIPNLPFPRQFWRGTNIGWFVVVTMYVMNAVGPGLANPLAVVLGTAVLSICAFIASIFFSGVLLDKLGEQAANGLAVLKDPNSLNSLAEAQPSLNDKRPESIRWTQQQDPAVARAIPYVASALTPEHYGTLTKRTILVLCGFLNRASEPDALMLIHGLKAAGTGDALEQIAITVKNGRTSAIRTAAEEVLPILIARNRNEQAPERLLRASSAPSEADDMLLRPLAAAQSHEPELLLRPIDSQS